MQDVEPLIDKVESLENYIMRMQEDQINNLSLDLTLVVATFGVVFTVFTIIATGAVIYNSYQSKVAKKSLVKAEHRIKQAQESHLKAEEMIEKIINLQLELDSKNEVLQKTIDDLNSDKTGERLDEIDKQINKKEKAILRADLSNMIWGLQADIKLTKKYLVQHSKLFGDFDSLLNELNRLEKTVVDLGGILNKSQLAVFEKKTLRKDIESVEFRIDEIMDYIVEQINNELME